MKVYELVSTIGYTKNILSHIVFFVWDDEISDGITIRQCSADDYIHLCGRDVLEWCPLEDFEIEDNNSKAGISITVAMEKHDNYIFYHYIKKN